MATIDLIVLGMLKKEPLSAYDLQKLVEYRNISKWVKISTPSIYKKVIQLEEKGYISSHIEREGKMPEKSVYSLTEKGKRQFEKLMLEISCKPINIFLDFNAVHCKSGTVCPEKDSKNVWINIESSMEVLKKVSGRKYCFEKKCKEDIPVTGMAVFTATIHIGRGNRGVDCFIKKRNQFVKVHGRNKRDAVIF